MNFYNPYSFPYQNVVPKTSSLRSLLGKINFSSIIGGTQKTLTTINQIIPIEYPNINPNNTHSKRTRGKDLSNDIYR